MASKRKHTISGPGASEVLASPGGEDLPGTSQSKGTSPTPGESMIGSARDLEPGFEPGAGTQPPVRPAGRPADPAADRVTGSQSGTIGGGGPDAHNPDPVRATGADDPTVADGSRRRQKKRTTKKY